MAVSAVFKADFTSFLSACNNAELKLKSFETDAASVEKQLNKMGNSFSGTKIIQEAHLLTKAMVDVGGITTLTDKELRKLGATVDEASQKMRKLGMEVPPGFQKITDAAAGAQKPTQSLSAGFALLTGAAAGFIAVNAVRWFTDSTKAALAYGDQLALLHAKTDLSYRDLQVLEDVGIGAGVSMDALANAIQVLQLRIGDGSANKGIRDLGVSIDAIKHMSPADMFATLGASIAKIKDPTERAQAAAAVFGKTWKEIMPALRANMAEAAKDAKIVGDAQIEAADRSGDRWAKFWSDQKRGWTSWLGNVVITMENAGSRFDEVNRRAAALQGNNTLGLPNAPTKFLGLGASVNDVDPAMISNLKVAGKTLEEQTKAIEANAKARGIWASITKDDAAGAEFAWQRELALTRFEAEHLMTIESRLFANRAAQAFASPNLTNIPGAYSFGANPNAGSFAGIGTSPSLGMGNRTFDTSDGGRFGGMNKSMAASAAMGGVGAMMGGGSAKSALGSMAMSVGTGAAISAMTTSATIASAAALGAATLGVGAAAIGAYIAVKKLWNAGKEGRQVSPLRDEFFQTAGGLEALNHKAMEATGSLTVVQRVFDAKTVDQYKAAVAGVNEALEIYQGKVDAAKNGIIGLEGGMAGIVNVTPEMEAAFDSAFEATTLDGFNTALGTLTGLVDKQANDTKALDDTMKKYGLSWTGAGDAAKAAKLGEISSGLTKDFNRLMGAGFDVNDVMRHMGKSVNDFVKDAQKAGGEVPESFKRIIQTAIDAGEIYDDNGVKIDDMKKLGLTFGDTMETTMKDVGNKILDLIKILTDRLAPAITNLPDGHFTVHGKYDIPDFPGGVVSPPWTDNAATASTGGLVTANGIQYLAGGGRLLKFTPRGTDTVPAMLTPGEVVLTSKQAHDLVSERNEMVKELAAMRREQRDFRNELPDALAAAIARAI